MKNQKQKKKQPKVIKDNKAEALIRGLVPELQELSFGCEIKVLFDNGNPLPIHEVLGRNDDRTIRTETYSRLNQQDIKIIGHPIHLEHILLAIERANPKSVDCEKNRDEGQEHQMYVYQKHSVVDLYNLLQPFNNQSEDLYQLIIELLQ